MTSDQTPNAIDTPSFDLAIRLYHSVQLLLLPLLWWSAERELFYAHQAFALLLAALLSARLCWALVGSALARFSSFVPSPKTLWRFLQTPYQTLGHNPLSALMILLFWCLLVLQISSGLASSDDVMFEGPWYGQGSDIWQAFAGFWHHFGFNVLLACIALHVVAAVYHQWRGDQVIRAITRGRKPMVTPAETGQVKPVWHYLFMVLSFLALYSGFFGWNVWTQALPELSLLF